MMFIRGHETSAQAEEAMRTHYPLYASRFGPDAFVRQIRSLDVHDTLAVADRLPELNVPARIVWGEADPFQKLEYGEQLAFDLGATLHRIPAGKHFTPEDHPDAVAQALRELLAEVPLIQALGLNPSSEGARQ